MEKSSMDNNNWFKIRYVKDEDFKTRYWVILETENGEKAIAAMVTMKKAKEAETAAARALYHLGYIQTV